MPDAHDELLNLYDTDGRVVGTATRRAAKASGRPVGAVQALVLGPERRVLLQRRPVDKENGGLWDKSAGGHVAAGEDFDQTIVREAGEELFGAPGTPRVRLLAPGERLGDAPAAELGERVLVRRVALQLNLRDVRRGPIGEGTRNVLYHVAVYLGRTALPLDGFARQREEIDALDYFAASEVDQLLLRGALAPNMGFLWLAQAHALLAGD
jgi:8-oxo-dGTP pyrophosphatase MutT (NUDIX family)